MQNKTRSLIVITLLVLLQNRIYCQTTEVPFTKETKIGFKAGTTVNGVNKALYTQLNDGLSTKPYKPIDNTYFINPYASVGLEYHFLKHAALHFNLGFYQTLQKYNGPSNFQPPAPQTVYASNIGYSSEAVSEYLNNNVFLELLPAYVYKHTRFLAGLNVTSTSPSVSTVIIVKDYNTGAVTHQTLKDKPQESYHVYTTAGIMQSFPIKTFELTVSVNYFGLLKKYDSGMNLAIGFLF